MLNSGIASLFLLAIAFPASADSVCLATGAHFSMAQEDDAPSPFPRRSAPRDGGIAILTALICAGGGYLIGKSKGRGGLGLILGLFLGCIGWIIVMLIPGASPAKVAGPPRVCRTCRRVIREGALHCQKCGPPSPGSPRRTLSS